MRAILLKWRPQKKSKRNPAVSARVGTRKKTVVLAAAERERRHAAPVPPVVGRSRPEKEEIAMLIKDAETVPMMKEEAVELMIDAMIGLTMTMPIIAVAANARRIDGDLETGVVRVTV